jgi:hypothetical protein
VKKGLPSTPYGPPGWSAANLLEYTVDEICGHVYQVYSLSICKVFSSHPPPIQCNAKGMPFIFTAARHSTIIYLSMCEVILLSDLLIINLPLRQKKY